MIFESSPIGHILRHAIQGGVITLISHGSRTSPRIKDVTKDIMEIVKPLETPPSHPSAKRKQQLKKLGELKHKADVNNNLCTGRTKTDHDKYHAKKEFQVG